MAAVAVLFALVSSAPVAGHAQSNDDDLRARALFEGGSKRLEAGDTHGALELYRDAFELAPRAKILLNVALLELKLGQNVAAANSMAAYADRADADAKALVVVRDELGKLDKTLGIITVKVGLPGAVTVDHKKVGQGPGSLQIRVQPGEHQVGAVGSTTQQVSVSAGARTLVTLTARPMPTSVVTQQQPRGVHGVASIKGRPTSRLLWKEAWFWTGGLTLGVASAGVVFGLQSRAASDDVDRLNAMSQEHDFSEAVPLIDRAESRGRLANIAFIAAGVGGAITLYLVLTAPGAARRPSERARAAVLPVPGGAVTSYTIAF